MNIFQGLLMMLGILLLLVALCAGVIFLERDFPSEKYDERQKQARGNAYRVSFWVSVIYYLAVTVYLFQYVEKGKPPVEPYVLLVAGFAIQALVFHIYCLMTNSALPLSEKPAVSISCYFGVGIIYLLQLLFGDIAEVLPLYGTGSSVWVPLIMTVWFFAMGVMHLIRFLWKEKE